MKSPLVFCLFFIVLLSCKEEPKTVDRLPTEPEVTQLNGEQLAKIHCASCHTFVPPQQLTKLIWKEDVLPAMGNRLGIYNGIKQPDSIYYHYFLLHLIAPLFLDAN